MKLEEELLPQLGDGLEPEFVKRLCGAAGYAASADWMGVARSLKQYRTRG